MYKSKIILRIINYCCKIKILNYIDNIVMENQSIWIIKREKIQGRDRNQIKGDRDIK